ncbi:MAG: SCO family protein [Phycisphaerales bacterium]
MPRNAGVNPVLRRLLGAAAAVALFACAAPAQLVQSELPKELQGVDLVQREGERIPMNLVFTEADNKPLPIADVFDDGRPVVLALVYYECPLACTIVMDRMAQSFADLDYVIGRDFNVLVVSFDPSEKPTQALATKQSFLSAYEKRVPETEENWSFCVADEENIQALADAVGFKTHRIAGGEFAHPVGIMILSPDGTISRYMLGYDYPARDMKLALLDASEGKIARTIGDRFLHYCYRYDPEAGSYSVEAMAVMRVAGALTVLGLVVLIGLLFVGERIRRGVSKKRRATRARDEGESYPAGRGVTTGAVR